MTIKSLMSTLESFAGESELVIEIEKEDGGTITTYDIGIGLSEFGELMLQIHG